MDLKLQYKEPACKWTEALPLGNGRIGAMVYGGTNHELICLNEDTLWSGYPANHNKKDVSKYVKKSAELTKQKKYVEAQKVLQDNVTGDYSQAYMPMGNLHIEMPHTSISEYSRELNIATAKHRVKYIADGLVYEKEAFISWPDQVFVYRITSNKAKQVNCKITFESELRCNIKAQKDTIEIEGLCPSHATPSYLEEPNSIRYYPEKERTGIRFHGSIKAVVKNGHISSEGGKLRVDEADEVIVYLSVRSNYNGYDQLPELAGKKYIEPALNDMKQATLLGFEQLKNKHEMDYKKYYDRVIFSLGKDPKVDIPMNSRLQKFNQGEIDKHLPEYLFQYGRYLLISASREGTQATNLQGIWNASLLPPWSSNYTININTQMNYWCVFMANLAEFNTPLVNLIEDLSLAGEETAREYYNATGFVAHHNTDIWKLTNPIGGARNDSIRYAFFGLSTGWLCEHLFEQYEYTRDLKFLKETAYPIMKKAAAFYYDTLDLDENGYLAMMPATSPENGFIYKGETCSLAKTSTMAMAIIKELFANCIKSCKILHIDPEFEMQLVEVMGKLYPYQIGSDGRLLEWNEEFKEEDPLHRHISHLYPLHPGRQITPSQTPELAKACKKVLEVKGLTGTGWSLVWKVNQWARLLDGERALELIKQQLHLVEDKDGAVVMSGGGSYANLFDAHPPFQIDGNFGIVSGIAEMLLQSYDNIIMLLPALPKEWKDGEVKGLCAKNAVTVHMKWKDSLVTEAKLECKVDAELEVYFNGSVNYVNAKANTEIILC